MGVKLMSNLIDDGFIISNYLNNKSALLSSEYDDKIKKAIKWSRDAMRTIMLPTENMEDLERQWINFNSMIKKHRRESDWMSLELFGMTNQDHYNYMKNVISGNDIDTEIDNELSALQGKDQPVSESYIDLNSADSYYNPDAINYTSADVEKARIWAEESNRVIILPTRTLEELEAIWDSFNMMIKKHRRESDWMSLEIFGVSNLHHYEYLKSNFLKGDIDKNINEIPMVESVMSPNMDKYFKSLSEESIYDATKALLEASIPNNGIYEELISNNIISDVLDNYNSELISSNPEILSNGDMPYLNPDEMIDMGVFGDSPADNYYGAIADNNFINENISTRQWFENYKLLDDGFFTEFSNMSSNWVNKVRELTYGLKSLIESGNDEAIRARKQSILELGWDPEIEFSTNARIVAREMAIHRFTSKNYTGPCRIIDLREFKASDKLIVAESSKNNKSLHPVYLIMIEGKSYFSKAIKSITHDIYSHAAISFDPQLHEMYSFGIHNDDSPRSGFRKEDIKNIPIGGRIGVFVFFVGDVAYAKLNEFVKSFKDNIEKTSYSFLNLFTYVFNIPYNREWKLVCSQFVDRCLQSAGINLTGKDSSQVSPSDLNKSMMKDKRIYNLYEGLASKYDYVTVSNLINALTLKATPLKESNSNYFLNERNYITGVVSNIENIPVLLQMKEYAYIVKNPCVKRLLEEVLFDSITIRPYCEVKEFPIQFDRDGSLLIKNLKKLDYEAEYAKSHKLLKEYKKAGNTDGMKYEISKLWMMLCLIEEKLHSKKFQELPSFAIETSSAHKAKAKINNDFQYYLNCVLQEEPDFNFTKYFDKSPFSSATIKINQPTMSFMGKLLRLFIRK